MENSRSKQHGEIGETSSNGFKEACKFIYIQALDPKLWNKVKHGEIDETSSNGFR